MGSSVVASADLEEIAFIRVEDAPFILMPGATQNSSRQVKRPFGSHNSFSREIA
jgi:hypothetical protein